LEKIAGEDVAPSLMRSVVCLAGAAEGAAEEEEEEEEDGEERHGTEGTQASQGAVAVEDYGVEQAAARAAQAAAEVAGCWAPCPVAASERRAGVHATAPAVVQPLSCVVLRCVSVERDVSVERGVSVEPLSCVVLRLGWLGFRQWDPWNPDEPSWGLSPLDCAQLFTRAVDAPPELCYALAHGVSRHRYSWLALEAEGVRPTQPAWAAAVSRWFLALNGSPCLRPCVHGALIGGPGGHPGGSPAGGAAAGGALRRGADRLPAGGRHRLPAPGATAHAGGAGSAGKEGGGCRLRAGE
jgi:hypothetical protein